MEFLASICFKSVVCHTDCEKHLYVSLTYRLFCSVFKEQILCLFHRDQIGDFLNITHLEMSVNTFLKCVDGPGWTRTTDLTLIRRAL